MWRHSIRSKQYQYLITPQPSKFLPSQYIENTRHKCLLSTLQYVPSKYKRIHKVTKYQKCKHYQSSIIACQKHINAISYKNKFLYYRYLSTSSKDRTIESIYQKKTPAEHVLLRPGMYIGSIEPTRDTMWMLSAMKNKSKDAHKSINHAPQMQQQSLEYVPALYKIFDEILVNALDNKMRDPTMKNIDVTIDIGNKTNNHQATISVCNDGRGIPVQFHSDHQVFVPELVLGQLLTGSNFDDTEHRLTGGRHGYGAKLTNIFSSTFIVETADKAAGKLYKQTWKNNMRERSEPIITSLAKGIKDFTRITFTPDLDRFGMKKLSSGMIQVLQKRVVDVAACLPDVQVTLNGTAIPISGFQSYIKTFHNATTTQDVDAISAEQLATSVYSRINPRWEIGVLPSDTGFVHVSFVNGMATLRGGTHVSYISEQLCRHLAEYINRNFDKSSDPLPFTVTGAMVRPFVALFINCQIENPTFDSQMKEQLSSRTSTYGSTCILPDRFIKAVISDTGIVERVVENVRAKARAALLKRVSSKSNSRASLSKKHVNVPKLDDANWAGTSKGLDCSLILTEGDSAKALAVAGLSIIGRDTYGVFPLRGKLLNVRDASDVSLVKNAEFVNLCMILGLKMDMVYDTPEIRKQELRYGRVIVMTDQDPDGSHIKGLLFNLFHTFWPELLQAQGPNFISVFRTPLLKVSMKSHKGGKSGQSPLNFFSIPEFMAWKNDQSSETLRNSHIKYYKGLGTSTSVEARNYFSNLPNHITDFVWKGPEDGEALEMVFSKSRTGDRKAWLLENYSSDTYLDATAEKSVGYKDFVYKELIQFSHMDVLRSLPAVLDGLKVSQRKVLFACFKRSLKSEMKVAQLAGYCSEQTAYHHGEASLHATIVNMAQDFVGANNLPLLVPSGQFGTRLQGGKDAASPRYIFTCLAKTTRIIFPEDDDALLTYLEDDGLKVEPTQYFPIIPMILVNGSEGIGTGWSTSIPGHHPVQIINALLEMLSGCSELDLELKPWVRGFQGKIQSNGNQTYLTTGRISKVEANEKKSQKNTITLKISELPVGKWVEDYKEWLWKVVGDKTIKSFTEHHTEKHVCFEIVIGTTEYEKLLKKQNKMDISTDLSEDILQNALIKAFKLESRISIGNMHAFDENGKLKKFETSIDILKAFYIQRLKLYEKRKAYLEKAQESAVAKLENRIRFIREVAGLGEDPESLELHYAIMRDRQPKAIITSLLRAKGYASSKSFQVHEDQLYEDKDKDYDYLLNTTMLNFTSEHVTRLEKDHSTRLQTLKTLKMTSAKDLWRNELLHLKSVLLEDPEFQETSDRD